MDSSERKTWQENTSLLYEFLNNYTSEWPALSLDWLTNIRQGDDTVARFLMGTCAESPRDNYVYVVDVNLGRPHGISMEDRQYQKRVDRMGFAYNDEKPVYRVRKRVHLPLGEIGRAKANLVGERELAACVTGSGEGVIIDRTILDTDPDVNVNEPVAEGEGGESVVARLFGHETAAWGLAWSYYDAGQLVTSSDDNRICTWDIQKTPIAAANLRPPWKNAKSIIPTQTYSSGHTQAVQCVAGHYEHPAFFISSGDDGRILIWDRRISDQEHAFFPIVKEPGEAFNSISQNKFRTHLLATAGTGPDVCLWDLRQCGYPIARLSHHDKTSPPRWMSNSVAFNPHREYLLASGGTDNKVILWDLRDIGKEQSIENAQDGPPELMFVHPGHTATVQDICWSPDEDWEFYVGSVSDSNEFQLWSYDRAVFNKENSEDEDELSDEDYDDNYPVE